MYLSIGQASIMLGISVSTIRRWEQLKKLLPTFRTSGGHRRYSLTDLKQYLGISVSDKKKVIAYARVSSSDQKEDLKRQVERLDNYCKVNSYSYEVIDDLGSGLNYKKRGLKKLIKLILTGQVCKLILTHKDRLLRFGSEIIFIVCNFFNITVEIIEENKNRTDEEVLAHDVLEIITVFSARMYGKRAHTKKKLRA